MRLSVIEQIARENEAILANSQLITSLSHDLRTPLTKLTGYLEILKYKKHQNASDEDRYLESAIENAEQMKNLSDEMFRHFQVHPTQNTQTNIETLSGTLLLSQILSEMCFDLEAAGFQVNSPVIEDTFNLSVSVFDTRRIFDNLFSNIKKYANPSIPIIITVNKHSGKIKVSISNSIASHSDIISNGIGFPTIKNLLEKYGGEFTITKTAKEFCTHIFLPLIDEKNIAKKQEI